MNDDIILENLSSFWRTKRSADRAVELRDLQESLGFMAKLILSNERIKVAWTADTAAADATLGATFFLDSAPIDDLPKDQPVPDERVDVLMGDVLFKSHLERIKGHYLRELQWAWRNASNDGREWEPQILARSIEVPGRTRRSRPTWKRVETPNPLSEISTEVARQVDNRQVASILEHLRTFHIANVAPPAVGKYVQTSRTWKRERIQPIIDQLLVKVSQKKVSLKDAFDFWSMFMIYGLEMPDEINEDLLEAMLVATPKAFNFVNANSPSELDQLRVMTDIVNAFEKVALQPTPPAPPPMAQAPEPSEDDEDKDEDEDESESSKGDSSESGDGQPGEPESDPSDDEDSPSSDNEEDNSESEEVQGSSSDVSGDGQNPDSESDGDEDSEEDFEDDEEEDSDSESESGEGVGSGNPDSKTPAGKSDGTGRSKPNDALLNQVEKTTNALTMLDALDSLSELDEKQAATVIDAIENAREDMTEDILAYCEGAGIARPRTLAWQKGKYDATLERQLRTEGYKNATGITSILRQFNRMASRNEHGRTDGSSLDARRLGRILRNDNHVFRQRTIVDNLDMALVLLMDASASIDDKAWKLIVEATASFVQATSNRDDVETIALAYSDRANAIELHRVYDKSIGKIHALRSISGSTPTAEALMGVREAVFKRLGRTRKDKVIIHLTDGQPNDGFETTKREVEANKKAGIETYCILVGRGGDQTATYGAGRFVHLTEFKMLLPCLIELFGKMTLEKVG